MSLTPGARLGVYEVVAPLGAGGMGEVYRARDTKLGREVAIKILADSFVDNPERITRFEREAQLLAALNHPHIAAIYGLESSGTTQFLVLELVEGETLAARLEGLRGSGLGIRESLGVARQIVDALQAAHEKGIIHRDLKPANIALTHDGLVKVLDFGLAKHDPGPDGSSAAGPTGLTHSPTLTFAFTQVGVILGTAAYMSPEQAKERAADKRSDVWAFGCVLFEMLTGTRAFDGEDVADIIAAVVRGEPNWSALPGDLSVQIRRLLERCLEKDRRQRIADIAAAQFLLTETIVPAPAPTPRTPATRSRLRTIAASAAGLIIGVAATAVVACRRGGNPNIYWQAADGSGAPERLTTSAPAQFPVSISPDGTRVASFTGTALGGGLDVNVLTLDRSIAPPPKMRTEPLIQSTATKFNPEISPDGRWIALQSNESGQPQIYVRPFPAIDSGRWQISPEGGTRPAWSRNGRELFYLDANDLLTAVSVATGATFSAGTPVRVLNTRYYAGSTTRGYDLRGYDVSHDGRRFLMVKERGTDNTPTSPATTIVVVLNWAEELQQRVPGRTR